MMALHERAQSSRVAWLVEPPREVISHTSPSPNLVSLLLAAGAYCDLGAQSCSH